MEGMPAQIREGTASWRKQLSGIVGSAQHSSRDRDPAKGRTGEKEGAAAVRGGDDGSSAALSTGEEERTALGAVRRTQ